MKSEHYDAALAEAQALHESSKVYSGSFLRPHKPFLTGIIKRLGITSALDYGCGKGVQYEWVDPEDGLTLEQAWGFDIFKFDPAWPPFAEPPPEDQKFDLVLCTHTLGAIPTLDHAWVLDRIVGHASKAVYIAEKLGPVKKKLSSDHRPIEWTAERWREHLTPHAITAYQRGIEFWFSVRHPRVEDEGVIVERWVWRAGWRLEWKSGDPQ